MYVFRVDPAASALQRDLQRVQASVPSHACQQTGQCVWCSGMALLPSLLRLQVLFPVALLSSKCIYFWSDAGGMECCSMVCSTCEPQVPRMHTQQEDSVCGALVWRWSSVLRDRETALLFGVIVLNGAAARRSQLHCCACPEEQALPPCKIVSWHDGRTCCVRPSRRSRSRSCSRWRWRPRRRPRC